jgi:TPP-dependent 2-oxoacid decarboxylase
MSETLVGLYLFERLKQLGVKTVFGVPGGMISLSPTLFLQDAAYSLSNRL